jgi:hypothetical protein
VSGSGEDDDDDDYRQRELSPEQIELLKNDPSPINKYSFFPVGESLTVVVQSIELGDGTVVATGKTVFPGNLQFARDEVTRIIREHNPDAVIGHQIGDGREPVTPGREN